MYIICITYHGRLVAEGLLKAEVSCMGDKPLQVGVGKKVLGKDFKNRKRFRKGQQVLGKDLCFLSLLAPVGEGNS